MFTWEEKRKSTYLHYLYGQLKLLMLSLELLGFRQGACVDEAGVQH